MLNRISPWLGRPGRLSCLCLLAAALHAAAPVIRDVYPHGAQRGKVFTLYLRGDGLVTGARVQSTLPASFSQLTLSKDPLAEPGGAMRPGAALPYLVSLKADAPPGLYPIRVLTPDGLSNVVLFAVDDFPEVEEIEAKDPKQPNNFPAEAQKVTPPVVINGTLQGPDIDTYSFEAKAGQKLVFEVEARRAGSAIDPAIEVFDAAGHELARNDDAPGLGVDARVEVTVPKTGQYYAQVHDSKFSDQAQNFYRLKIGHYQYADAMFPLGWRRDEVASVTLSGGNLAQPVKVNADLHTKSPFVFVRLPGSSGTLMPLAVSDGKEALEPDSGTAELAEDTVMNGRIAKPGEVDRYHLRVEPGQKWMFEVAAASLGTSQLDAILTLYDSAGKKLASGDDGNGVDPVLPFTVPKDVHEVTVALEDLLGRGGDGFGYRLSARQQEPDFSVDLATPFVNVPAGGTAQIVCIVQRRGYAGELRLRIPNLPAGFHQAGGHVPSEAAAQLFNNDNAGRRTARSVITITADPGVKSQSLELAVMAEAQTPSGVMRRQARGPGLITAVRGDKQKPFTAPWLGMQLPMATTSPLPITVEVPAPMARFAQGFEYTLDYKIRKQENVRVMGKPNLQIAGLVGNIRILKDLVGKKPDSGAFLVNTNFSTPLTTLDLIVETQAEIDGKQVKVGSPVIEVEVVAGYRVDLASTTLEIAPGGKAEIAGRVDRELTFEGSEIRVRAEDLPDHVKCREAVVPADQRDFVLACSADAEAKPGTQEIRIASAAPNTGRKAKQEYKIEDLNARLIVGKPAVSSAQNRREP